MRLILNLTEGTYIRCSEEDPIQLLKELYWAKNEGEGSRWSITDRVIYVPKTAEAYVMAMYGQMFV